MRATHNIADLNAVLAEYQRLRGMTAEDVLRKQGGKLAREIKFQLLAIAPEAGEIRQEIFARLMSGRGIKIRDSVREANEVKMLRHYVKRFGYRPGKRPSRLKKLNYQNELIKREIGVREKGRKVMGVSARHPRALPDNSVAVSRYSTALSRAGVRLHREGGSAQIAWRGLSKQGRAVAEGMERPRAKAATERAIHIVTADTLVYVRRKQKQLVERTVRKIVRR